MKTCSALLVLFFAIVSGCGRPATDSSSPPVAASSSSEPVPATPSAPASEAPAAAATEIKHVDASSFSLGEYLPPLDGGRIEIAPPVDWNPMPRDSDYVVRFYQESRSSLPRIDVVVEEKTLGGVTTLAEANLPEFVAAVAAELAEQGTAVLEPPIPMVIGSVPCARFVSHLKLKIGEGTLLVERQTLALAHAGRIYKINLLVMPNQLSASRDAAYAVCSGVRFLDTEATAQ